MKHLTDLKLKVAREMSEVMSVVDADDSIEPPVCFFYGDDLIISDREWPHIVDEMIREKLPADKREEFLNRLNLRDPSDHLLRFVVQHWWVKAEVYFEVMK